MPLRKPRPGATASERREAAGFNIAAERRSGRPVKQAIAIGLAVAGLSNRRKKTRGK